ncbi:hypothetical protein [Roseibium sp. Sym1]|uniref:hypothetical protein n=1 Tax=Roseibium sp. Sym1 TaxID=3016006 RepID=UPI0022B4B2AB|nr:hypothetical protein [Roseibium sp. Sym1]
MSRNSMRRVPFPEAGTGMELRLKNPGFATLFNKYGLDYFAVVEKGLLFYDFDLIETMLTLCLEKQGKNVDLTIEDLNEDLPLEKLRDKLLDAFTLAANGRTYSEQVEWTKEQAAKLEDENPSLASPGGILSNSETEPTGQESAQTNSTN